MVARKEKVLLTAAQPGRPRFYVFVLLEDGRILRRGHFFSHGKPDSRLEVAYQDFGKLPADQLEARFRTWATRCNLEIVK